jgi:ATP-binding cassette subfamily F protein 3
MEAVDEFPGAAIIVTHNELMLRRLATKLVVFQNDRAFLFLGTYAEFLERIGWNEEGGGGSAEAPVINLKPTPATETPRVYPEKLLSRKEIKRARAEFVDRRSQTLAPLSKKMEKLEANITELEAHYERMNQDLIRVSQSPERERIGELSRAVAAMPGHINRAYEQLAAVTEQYEREKERFAREEKELGE